MKFGSSRLLAGHGTRSWPVLLLLLVVVLVPTLGVLWFMSQAMGNERLAVRQKLSDVYEAQLLEVQHELRLYWRNRSTALEVRDPTLPDSRLFADSIRGRLADSVVVYDAAGHPAYPAPPHIRESDLRPPSANWRRAERLEHSGQNAAAAARYASIAKGAEGTADRNLAARALQAQARCLAKSKLTPKALAILIDELGRPEYATASDRQGRLIAPSAQLRALQLIAAEGPGEGETSPAFEPIVTALSERLSDYDNPEFPAAQRRFLMNQLATLVPSASPFDTLAGEELAQRYLDSTPPSPLTTSLQPSGLPQVWHLASPSGAVVALFDQRRLLQDLQSLVARHRLPQGATVDLLAPGVEAQELFLVSLPVGGLLQDWQLVLRLEDQTLFAAAANQRINAYLLTGVLVVLVILILTLLIARAIGRQLRLTRLKNDLLATVSHELKTPLASMRLLVDTLLETGIDDSSRVREYLHLIAKENVRLSRLVDNFLTFSRMEQNRQSFEKKQLSPAAVIQTAAESVSERFATAGCRFEVEVGPDLPLLLADHDALVTVLLNLLDNAYKYSNPPRHIVLRGYREKGLFCFAVRDNGIGLPTREAGKIFDRFYQVDQTLSRSESGTGLGLSIVQFIVSAHRGSVEVDSRPGEGSTFTVRLPPADPAGSSEQRNRKEPS